jgi:hypothetical protein
MHTSTSARRLGVAALAAALAGSGLLASATPARAATVTMTASGASVTFNDFPDAGVTCTHSGPGDVFSLPPGTFAANGVPVTSTASSSGVITDAGNASDKTTMSGSITSTVTATGVGGQLTSLHVAATASASLTTAVANTKCGASVAASGGATFQFDLAVPTLVTITSETHRLTGVAQVANINGASPGSGDIDGVLSYNAGAHATNTASAVLRAGTGLISIAQIQAGFNATDTASSQSVSGDLTLDITFQPAGAASTAPSGSAGKYVSLGAGRDCAGGTLPLTWTKKAGKGKHRVIKKATVTVNGTKVATVKKPKKGEVTLLKGLTAEKAADVAVSFKIKGKGKFEVERSYLRCS